VTGAELAHMIAGGIASVAVVCDPSASAHADEPCARVVVPPTLSEAWARAVADLRTQIAQLPASDCEAMTLALEPHEEGMRIVALTGDGRRAERIVRRAESLVARALGLLMTIPEVSPSGPTTSPHAPVTRDVGEPQPAPTMAGTVTPTARGVTALWAGLSGGIRLATPTSLSVVDVEARADIFFDRWLMLVSLQSSLLSCLGQQGLDCDVYNDVSLGVGVGRRLPLGGPDVDFAFAPSVVVMHMEYDGDGAEGQALEGTEVALRFDASARLAVPINPHWVVTLTLDGGLAPSMLTSPARLSLPVGAPAGVQQPPPFPAWSGGVRLGASGALL